MSVLECSQLCKHYGRVQALDGVDLTLEPGRIVGLLGPNGSGKSTLIKLACGLLTPSEGSIQICGKSRAPSPMRLSAICRSGRPSPNGCR